MLRTLTPSTLLVDRVRDFQCHLPGIYDGNELAIHDARVALRRVSEALSLARGDYDEHALAAIEARLAKAARALGRVRDADSGQQVIHDVEQRFPFAAATLSRLRLACADQQLKSRRKAIKKFEALELDELARLIERARRRPARRWLLAAPAWKASLLSQVADRAEHLRASIVHATGVYFSKRAHSTRIAVKQLRYTLELASTLGARPDKRSVRLLKKAQEVLGAAHDRDVLLNRLDQMRRRDGSGVDLVEADALARFLRSETLTLHQRYIARRDELLAICAACTAPPRRGLTATRAAVIAGVGVPSILLLSRNSTSTQTE
jgi:CHAD domain-containing protein